MKFFEAGHFRAVLVIALGNIAIVPQYSGDQIMTAIELDWIVPVTVASIGSKRRQQKFIDIGKSGVIKSRPFQARVHVRSKFI